MDLACVLYLEEIFKNDVFRQITLIFPIVLERPSLALAGFSNTNLLQGKTQATSVRIQRKNPHEFPSFWHKVYLLRIIDARALWSRGRRHVRRKNDRPKSSKNIVFDRERISQSQVLAGLERNRHRRAPAPGRPQSRRLRVELL